MDRQDLLRDIQMIHEAVEWAAKYHERNSEQNAAEHCNPRVFYSPLAVRLADALQKTERLMVDLEGETDGGIPALA